MALNIKEGKQQRAQKVVIYGPEGIGKSTLAAQFPDPLFIDLENGTSQLDVKRIDSIRYWQNPKNENDESTEPPERGLVDSLLAIIREGGLCKTLVIDTADAAESLAKRHVCAQHGVNGIEGLGYGKGYTYLAEQFAMLLSTLDIFMKRGYNVVMLAHAKITKFEQPDELGAYDRFELKLEKKVAPLLKEWSDLLLFCNYKTTVAVDSKTNKAKASGGKRVIYTTHNACWDAKNRHGLADMIEMDYSNIKHIFEEVKENE